MKNRDLVGKLLACDSGLEIGIYRASHGAWDGPPMLLEPKAEIRTVDVYDASTASLIKKTAIILYDD